MRRYAQIIKIILALLMFGAFSFAPACEPGIDFKIINKTDTNIKIYNYNSLWGEVAPGKVFIYRTLATAPVYPITVKNVTGDIIYAINITRNEVSGKQTYEVVIPPSSAK